MNNLFENKLLWIVLIVIVVIVIIIVINNAQKKENEQPGDQMWVTYAVVAIILIVLSFMTGWYLRARMSSDPVSKAVTGTVNLPTTLKNSGY